MSNKTNYHLLRKSLATSLVACMTVSMVGCSKGKSDSKDTSKNGETTNLSYTYNDYLAGSPDTWNPHEWETRDDRYILDETTMGLYDFQLNDTKDGYEIVPEMAAEFPVDITSEYAGNEIYGVPKDATSGYAFKIALNEKACWEDGTPITADTYIYSMQQMLNPKMSNYRSSNFTSGNLVLANAQAYLDSGKKIYTPIYDGEGYRDVEDKDMFFSLTETVPFFGDSATSQYESGNTEQFKDADGNDLYEKYSENSYYELTEEAKKDLLTISAAFGDDNKEAYKEYCFTFDGVGEEVSFDKVGLIKTGDYELTLVLEKEISDFYLKYNLGSNWLVYEDLYEKNKKETGDIVKTTYGTSTDNYMSYGPYKLVEYQTDKQITLEKNDKWYGYTDGKHEGQFQTTNIDCQIVEAQATALQLFLQGKLDRIDLVADDMDKYRSSDYAVFTPESYTSKITFNSDKDALKKRQTSGINKTILSYQKFRKGLSLAIDRIAFATQCTATHKAGYGILNNLYISDPETGETYRSTEQAKQALCNYYGVDSEDQITGYNKEEAAKLITEAYNEALKNGDIKENDTVELEYLVYSNDDAYVKIVNFVQDAFSEAAVGTPLEGKIKIKMTPDADYYDHAQQGKFEMIMTTWGGSALSPFDIMECYAEDGKFFEYGFKPKKVQLTININGKDITKSFYDWYKELVNGEYSTADVNTKVTILAGMEQCILEQNCTTPLYYRTKASLYSQKVVLGTDVFVAEIEYGKNRHMTYSYDDASWQEYCNDNNNQLNY